MTQFRCPLRPGESIFGQVVYRAKKAFISGDLQPGQPFPSIRALAADLKIHPNTAHKIVQHLIEEGFLTARPGLGTVVSELPAAPAADRERLLQNEVEEIVVEAKRVGLRLGEIIEAIERQWAALGPIRVVSRK